MTFVLIQKIYNIFTEYGVTIIYKEYRPIIACNKCSLLIILQINVTLLLQNYFKGLDIILICYFQLCVGDLVIVFLFF